MSISVNIRNPISGEFEKIGLSQNTNSSLINELYEVFGELRMEGPIAKHVEEREIISLKDCKDYSDDFIYDEQQYRQYFTKRTWEQFDLSDAAFLIGYLHVAPTAVRYSALPFLTDLILRADQWVDAFSSFVSRLRDDLRVDNFTSVADFYNESTKNAILSLLDAIKSKAEESYHRETVTVTERAIRDLKKNM